MSTQVFYGIDLGTTNSVIAKYDGAEVQIVKNRDLMDVTPSVVRIERSGRIIVGRRAYQTLYSDPENVAAEFKRWMGQSDRKEFKALGRSLDAEELSAEVLKSLLEDARRLSPTPVESVVITVPAAFGQLQCEATARSATRAGIVNAALIQEPLAASIAYGMKPDARDKHWLVYDLGGGTFDLAVISTKDGRLSVLEHKGDNMLGGKDFDRAIVDQILLPRLKEHFNLPDPNSSRDVRKLVQFLRLKAEEVKTDLSTSESSIVIINDVGTDLDGKPIELEVEVRRNEINTLVEPYVRKTIRLCREALSGARLTSDEIASLILVGGPSYMPIVREMLATELRVPLDYSIDPMTVVARGAAIYASSIPVPTTQVSIGESATVSLQLAYEPVWPDATCLVAGRVSEWPRSLHSIEILIESETGVWKSGWVPIKDGFFELKVHLLEESTNRFWVYLRDEVGRSLSVSPDSFSIRHGLAIAEPPLPHSVGVEVVGADGRSEVDNIFPRSTPLPITKRIVYKARRALKPGKNEDCLAVKVWEGEWVNDPEANTFVGALKINATDIRRTVPEGADIELSISISASRLMDVRAYVPILSQYFQESVYVAKDNQRPAMDEAQEMGSVIDDQVERLEKLEKEGLSTNDAALEDELTQLRKDLDELTAEQERVQSNQQDNPDAAKKLVHEAKNVRGKLSSLEKKIGLQRRLPESLRRIDKEKEIAGEVVQKWGEKLDKKEYEILCKEAERISDKEDERMLTKVANDFAGLKWRVLARQPWWWKECFEQLSVEGTPYVNKEEATSLILAGQQQLVSGDFDSLQSTVRKLWDLQPKDNVEMEQQIALQSGIKRRWS
jgi:molecular chaperone DnaK